MSHGECEPVDNFRGCGRGVGGNRGTDGRFPIFDESKLVNVPSVPSLSCPQFVPQRDGARKDL
jgi:hypothetical protein